MLTQIMAAERFEQFLHKRFLGVYRFSLEGGEALIPLLDALIEGAADRGAEEIVLAMAHRGRLNVMAHTHGHALPRDHGRVPAVADAGERAGRGRREVPPRLLVRPAHARRQERCTCRCARTRVTSSGSIPWPRAWSRAKQNCRGDTERTQVIPLQIHGDAAFTGQGDRVRDARALRARELLDRRHDPRHREQPDRLHHRARRLPLHAVPERHAPRTIQAPIFHVNADDPEACVHAAQARDRVPPAVPRRRDHRPGLLPAARPQRGRRPDLHAAAHVQEDRRARARGADLHRSAAGRERARPGRARQARGASRSAGSSRRSRRARTHTQARGRRGLPRTVGGARGSRGKHDGKTAVAREVARDAARARWSRCPPGFHVHPKLRRMLEQRAQSVVQDGEPIDWGTAEALALGHAARRGRHRAAHRSGRRARHLRPPPRGAARRRERRALHAARQARRRTARASSSRTRCSPRRPCSASSTATAPSTRVGSRSGRRSSATSANSAQVIIDQFIASGEKKWSRASGLVHAPAARLRGQGPRALERAARALPAALRRGQPAGLQPVDARAVLPRAAPPDPPQLPQAAGRDVAEEPAAPPEVRVAAPTSSCRGEFRDGDRRSGVRARAGAIRTRRAACCCAAARSTTRCSRRARTTASRTSRSCASSSSTRSRSTQLRAVLARYAARDVVVGAGRALEHGRLVVRRRTASRRVLPAGGSLRYVGSAASPRARRPARTGCTRKSRPSSCARRSRRNRCRDTALGSILA